MVIAALLTVIAGAQYVTGAVKGMLRTRVRAQGPTLR
jgi:hypothetical protein